MIDNNNDANEEKRLEMTSMRLYRQNRRQGGRGGDVRTGSLHTLNCLEIFLSVIISLI